MRFGESIFLNRNTLLLIVSTLLNTIKEMSALIPGKDIQIVMDRGGKTAKNYTPIFFSTR
jgi:hypothetical protein